MKKELKWFKFSPANWSMGRIQRQSLENQALFIRICCQYWFNDCKYSIDDSILEIGKESFDELLENKIIELDGEFIKIKFLDDQKKDIAKVSKVRRKVANDRWSKQKNASAMQLHTKAYNIDKIREDKIREDKIREDKIREEKIIEDNPTMEDFVDFFKENKYKEEIAKNAWHYYNDNGWKDKNGKDVKNWKNKLRQNWFKPEYENRKKLAI